MSFPTNEDVLKRLEEVADENRKAGKWLYIFLPNSFVPIPKRNRSSQDVLEMVKDDVLE